MENILISANWTIYYENEKCELDESLLAPLVDDIWASEKKSSELLKIGWAPTRLRLCMSEKSGIHASEITEN